MPGPRDALVMCANVETDTHLSRNLKRVRDFGTCEFGGEKVIYNRDNINALKSRGKKPVLICVQCYTDGKHIKQGYTNA